jgi:hypothetical protein
MALDVRYKKLPNYLLVMVHGKWEELDVKEEIEALREEADKAGITRLLLDVRNMLPPDSQMTRLATGGHIAKVLTRPFRVVALAEPEMIDGLTENSAVSQGATFKVFSDTQAAIEWLNDGTEGV